MCLPGAMQRGCPDVSFQRSGVVRRFAPQSNFPACSRRIPTPSERQSTSSRTYCTLLSLACCESRRLAPTQCVRTALCLLFAPVVLQASSEPEEPERGPRQVARDLYSLSLPNRRRPAPGGDISSTYERDYSIETQKFINRSIFKSFLYL